MVRYDLNLFEVWRPIPGYEGLYEVSTEGRIWSNRSHRILSVSDNGGGYKTIKLGSKKEDRFLVHRLVCLTFNQNPDPEHYTEVNHINEDKSDNRACNLEWCDRKYNINYGTGIERALYSKVKNGNASSEYIGLSREEKKDLRKKKALDHNKVYYNKNKLKLNELNKLYYQNHREEILEKTKRRYYENH